MKILANYELKDMGQDNYQGPKIWRDEAIKTEADYYKTQDWINKIENCIFNCRWYCTMFVSFNWIAN